MSTIRQKKAIRELVENGGNASKAMIAAGYSPNPAHTPSKLTRSKGFQEFREICSELGLDAELVVKSLAEDIKEKPRDRASELLLAAKILGLLEKEKASQDPSTTSSLLLAPFDAVSVVVAIPPRQRRSSLNRERYGNILTTTAREKQRRLNAPKGKTSPLMI